MSENIMKVTPGGQRVTLNNLKDQLYSLNMRLLLAVQYHNVQAQEEIEKQMTRVKEDIERMRFGCGS